MLFSDSGAKSWWWCKGVTWHLQPMISRIHITPNADAVDTKNRFSQSARTNADEIYVLMTARQFRNATHHCPYSRLNLHLNHSRVYLVSGHTASVLVCNLTWLTANVMITTPTMQDNVDDDDNSAAYCWIYLNIPIAAHWTKAHKHETNENKYLLHWNPNVAWCCAVCWARPTKNRSRASDEICGNLHVSRFSATIEI